MSTVIVDTRHRYPLVSHFIMHDVPSPPEKRRRHSLNSPRRAKYDAGNRLFPLRQGDLLAPRCSILPLTFEFTLWLNGTMPIDMVRSRSERTLGSRRKSWILSPDMDVSGVVEMCCVVAFQDVLRPPIPDP